MVHCKKYEIKGNSDTTETFKCSERNVGIQHSEYCLKEKELKAQHASAESVEWNPEKQIWSINFNQLSKVRQAETRKATGVKETERSGKETEENEVEIAEEERNEWGRG